MAEADEINLLDPVRVSFDEETGYLVLELDKNEYGYANREAHYRGKTFQPKEELHITVVSRETAAAVADCVKQSQENAGQVHGLIDSIHWSFRKLDHYYHIQDGQEETIIQMVALPELHSFFSELSRIVGQGLVLPPAHVTLYLRNSENGIGLPTGETLEQLAQAEIRLADFLGEAGE